MLNNYIHKNYKFAYNFFNGAKSCKNIQSKILTSNIFIIQRRFYHLYQRLDNQLYFSSSKLAQRFSVVNRNNSCVQIRYFSFSWLENLAVTQSKYFQALSSSEVVLKTMDTLQYVHDTTHLPWWLSIVITTAFLRTAITLPLAAFQNYIIAKMENLRPEMDELIKVLKKETAFAIKKFQWDEKYAKRMYNRSVRYDVLEAQILCMELSHGGFGWLPNLTEVDHSLILPFVMCICNILIVDINTASRKKATNMRKFLPYIFKSISIVLLPIAANVPGCLSMYGNNFKSFLWVLARIYF
ncbi:Mitochondrial inner membrane protein COX18 [Armadillidium vulgare]|nr:Mitochondrial inner membrane protein COX18 [Armadillidium vulgare]